jgi:hypothetical protein
LGHLVFLLVTWFQALTAEDGDFASQIGFSIPGYGQGGELLWNATGSCAENTAKNEKIFLNCPSVSLFAGRGKRLRSLIFESQSAEFDAADSSMVGDSIVHVVGCGFTAVGDRWTFLGKDGTLRLDGHIQVFFETEQAGGDWQHAGDDCFTATSSGGLLIENGNGSFTLHFSGQTSLRAQNYLIHCDELTVEIPLPCGEEILGQNFPTDSFRLILARGNVRMDDPERHMEADDVRIFPGFDGAIILSGNVQIIEGGKEMRGQRALIRCDRHCILAGAIPCDGEPILDLD